MSAEGSNLTFEADEEEIFTSSEASDPIIKDFIEVLHLAQRKVCLSTKYTARDTLLASKLVLPSSLAAEDLAKLHLAGRVHSTIERRYGVPKPSGAPTG